MTPAIRPERMNETVPELVPINRCSIRLRVRRVYSNTNDGDVAGLHHLGDICSELRKGGPVLQSSELRVLNQVMEYTTPMYDIGRTSGESTD